VALPGPAEPYDSLPGCARASASSSFTFAAGTDACTASRLGWLAISVTGTKSRRISKGSFVYSAGEIASEELETSTVWPSGCAFAASAVPTTLPAPGRLSTTTV
jgi:hypothetical protein